MPMNGEFNLINEGVKLAKMLKMRYNIYFKPNRTYNLIIKEMQK